MTNLVVRHLDLRQNVKHPPVSEDLLANFKPGKCRLPDSRRDYDTDTIGKTLLRNYHTISR